MTKIQEILEIGLEEYLKKQKIVGYKQKVIKAIKNCKSEKLGVHKYVCDECGYEEIAYNSCRNRHCPNCQTGKKLKWIEANRKKVKMDRSKKRRSVKYKILSCSIYNTK